MNKLKQLEIKKLIKELDYIESDFEYKSEIIVENDSKFMMEVSSFLDRNKELKDIFDKKVNDRVEDIIKKSQESENKDIIVFEKSDETIEDESEVITDDNQEIEDIEENNIVDIKSSKIKKLYREIVKLTHPDRVNNQELNDLYIKSTNMYDNNDLASIYAICNELNIEYEIDEDDADNITMKIKTLKDRIVFVESTFTWKWHYSQTQQEKDNLVFLYIRMQL